MNCHSCRDVVLDLARGVMIPPAAARAAEGHLATCSTCADELWRQRELTLTFEALAAGTQGCPAPDEVEERLLRRFDGEHAGPVVPQVTRRRPFHGWPVAAAAAIATLMVWAWPREQQRHDVATAVRNEQAPEREVRTASHAAPEVNAPSGSAAKGRIGEGRRSRPGREGRRPSNRGLAVPELEFMPLPGASALPAFESGSIVRVELPVAALPAYGLSIVPDPTRPAVEADVIVGQDGQARAIRLVPLQDESRSRQ
jgi:hypothetical protein